MDGPPAYPVRASDGERERVLQALSDRVAEGRISTDTFERRVDLVLRARSRSELVDLVHDLPPRGRLVSALTSVVASVSAATAQIGAAWRAPRLPRFVLPPAELTRILIGRAPGCHFVLTDLTVSRFHAELSRGETAGTWLITDLGSMNGTRVNGWRLTGPAPLRPGDQVGFGNLTFVVAPR
jgi:hypothetical protein